MIQYACTGSRIGWVAVENKTNYYLLTADGACVAEPTGKFLFSAGANAGLPKTGDWIVFMEAAPGRAVVHAILPRQSKLARKVPGKKLEEQVIAANLEVVFIVQGLDAHFTVAKLERFLSIAGPYIQPAIVLNNCDLAAYAPDKVREVREAFPAVPVIAASAKQGQLDELRAFLRPGRRLP